MRKKKGFNSNNGVCLKATTWLIALKEPSPLPQRQKSRLHLLFVR